MVRVAFRNVHDVFNLVQKGCGYERGLISDQVICIHFYHVVSAGIALSAYFVHFITDAANRCFVARSCENARDFIPRGIGDDHVMRRNVLVGLHVIYHAANVGIELLLDGLYHFIRHVQALACADLCYEFVYFRNGQLVEAHAHKLGLQCLVNAADVVAYQTKPHVVLAVVVAVEQVSQRHLRVLRHVIHFIQYYKFCSVAKERFGRDETVDLNADDVDASLVGRIQMDHQAAIHAVHSGLLILDNQIYDGRGFSCSRWPVKQQVGEMPRGNDVAHHQLIQWVQHNFVETSWTIFLHPRR